MKRGSSVLACLVLLLALQAFSQLSTSPSSHISREGQDEALAADDSSYRVAMAAIARADLEGAENNFRQSLSVLEKLVPGSIAVARTLNGLGDVAQQRGIPRKAEAYYQQALTILQKLDSSGAEAANSLDGLARAALDGGDTAKFELYALQAFAIRQKLDSNNPDLALSLNSVAEVYKHHEQWDKAEESLKKALLIQEKQAPESLALAETLKNLGRFLFGRRRYEEAATDLQKALTLRKKIAPDGLAVADSLRWLGACTRNNAVEQDRYYRAALVIQQSLAPGSIHVALTLMALAETEQFQGDLVAAERDSRQALAMWEQLTPDGGRSRRQMYDLAQILVLRGDLAGAEEFAVRALDGDRKEDPMSNWVGWDLALLAQVAVRRGDLVGADHYYHEALEIGERHDPGGLMSARMMGGIGFVAANQEDLAKAEEYYRRALAVWGKINPEGNSFAQGLFAIGSVIHRRGDLAQAQSYYGRALAIWERVVPDSLYVAQALGAQGRLARDQGDLARAEEYQRQAIAIEQRLAPGGAALAQGLNDLGDVLLSRGALPEALECHKEALAIRERLAPGNYYHAASLAAVAGIMRRQGNWDAAEQYYQQALDVFENRVAQFGGGDELRAGFRAKYSRYYKDYVDLLVEQKRFELAFQVLERFRARTLLETLTVAQAEIRKDADPELLRQQRGLQQSLAAKTQRRIQLLGDKSHDAELTVLDKNIQDLHSQYQELEERVRASSPKYAALMHPRPISAKDTQEQLLDEDSVLLEYSLGEERSYVWALTRDSLAVYELPKRLDIEQTARELYHLLTARSEIHQESVPQRLARLEQARQSYREKAALLSRMVLEPAAGQIKDKKRLFIVSDGALQYIPFVALPIPRTTMASNEEQATPLLMTHEIVNLPSASVLAALRQPTHREKPSKEVAVLADAVFDKEDPRVRMGQRPGKVVSHGAGQIQLDERMSSRSVSREQLARAVPDIPAATRGGAYLMRLPFSRLEALEILSYVPSKEAMRALDFQANRAKVLGSALASYRIVHFATHGLVDSEHPEWSGLVFSLVNSHGETEDGFLRLEDIYNMRLSADLVVLSACNTGLGREIQGEGLVGLTQGFMYAGAPQVVASLWNVNDAATAELMGRFYRAMEKEKTPPVAALRQAQIEIMKQKRWSDPYYWAAFVIHGGPPR